MASSQRSAHRPVEAVAVGNNRLLSHLGEDKALVDTLAAHRIRRIAYTCWRLDRIPDLRRGNPQFDDVMRARLRAWGDDEGLLESWLCHACRRNDGARHATAD